MKQLQHDLEVLREEYVTTSNTNKEDLLLDQIVLVEHLIDIYV